jgi:hypothetical protein
MSLYAKRLERDRFIWPSPTDGAIAITAAQLPYMLEEIGCMRRCSPGDAAPRVWRPLLPEQRCPACSSYSHNAYVSWVESIRVGMHGRDEQNLPYRISSPGFSGS